MIAFGCLTDSRSVFVDFVEQSSEIFNQFALDHLHDACQLQFFLDKYFRHDRMLLLCRKYYYYSSINRLIHTSIDPMQKKSNRKLIYKTPFVISEKVYKTLLLHS